MKASPAEFLTDENKKQHMRNAVQPNPDLRQVASFEDIVLYPKKYNYLTYLHRLCNAADNYDGFAKDSRLYNGGRGRMDITTWNSITPMGQQIWNKISGEDQAIILSARNKPGTSAPPPQSQAIPKTFVEFKPNSLGQKFDIS